MAIEWKRFILYVPKAIVEALPGVRELFDFVAKAMAAFERHIDAAGYVPDTSYGGRLGATWPGQWMPPEPGDTNPRYGYYMRALRVADGPTFTSIENGDVDVFTYTGDTNGT